MYGQVTSADALATACGEFAEEPEKKLDIFWLSVGELGGGGTVGSDAAGAGPPKPPPAEQPDASNASDSKAATDARSHQFIW